MKKRISAIISSLLMFINNACSFSQSNDRVGGNSLVERLKNLGAGDDEVPDLTPFDNAMCYDPGDPVEDFILCSKCGEDAGSTEFLMLSNRIQRFLPGFKRYGYDVSTSAICYDCLKKMLENHEIETDLKSEEKLEGNTPYIILSIGKENEPYRQIVITKEEHLDVVMDYLRGEKETFTEEEQYYIQLVLGLKPVR